MKGLSSIWIDSVNFALLIMLRKNYCLLFPVIVAADLAFFTLDMFSFQGGSIFNGFRKRFPRNSLVAKRSFLVRISLETKTISSVFMFMKTLYGSGSVLWDVFNCYQYNGSWKILWKLFCTGIRSTILKVHLQYHGEH